MKPMDLSLRLREKTADSAARIASVLGGGGHCALFFWGSNAEVEVVDRRGLPLQVCAALSTDDGKNLLAWARKSGSAHRVRGESLRGVAPDLFAALREHGIDSLALVPFLGDRGVVGFVCIDLQEGWEGESVECSGAVGCWCQANRIPGMLQLAAGNAAMRTVLKVREKEPPDGLDGILVLDEENRVLFAHGFLRELPEWNSDEVLGRPVKSLPGGKIMAAIGMDSPSRLLWKERRLPSHGSEGIPVGIAASALQSDPPGPKASTVYLLRDMRERDAEQGRPGGAFLLELAMRLSHLACQLVDSGLKDSHSQGDSAPVGDPAPEGDLNPSWLEGALEESDVLLRSALAVADSDHRRKPVDLAELLKDLQGEYAPDFMEERIQILPILSPDLPLVSGDARRLKTAFRILMLTSRTSLHPIGGTIFLRAWEDDGNVFCTVSDDGPGMEETEVDELMALEPLFEIDGRRAPVENFGAVRSLVEDLGGRLHIESRPQLWTRFTVMVPAYRGAEAFAGSVRDSLPPAVEVRSAKPGSLEVLVVDDNESIRAILRRFLETRGHQVTEAGDGGEALELVRGHDYDRLMVDVYMPGLTGTEFFEGLDDVAPTMKERTIFMTGGIQDYTMEDYVEATGRPSLEKPFDLGEMVRTLEG